MTENRDAGTLGLKLAKDKKLLPMLVFAQQQR